MNKKLRSCTKTSFSRNAPTPSPVLPIKAPTNLSNLWNTRNGFSPSPVSIASNVQKKTNNPPRIKLGTRIRIARPGSVFRWFSHKVSPMGALNSPDSRDFFFSPGFLKVPVFGATMRERCSINNASTKIRQVKGHHEHNPRERYAVIQLQRSICFLHGQSIWQYMDWGQLARQFDVKAMVDVFTIELPHGSLYTPVTLPHHTIYPGRKPFFYIDLLLNISQFNII